MDERSIGGTGSSLGFRPLALDHHGLHDIHLPALRLVPLRDGYGSELVQHPPGTKRLGLGGEGQGLLVGATHEGHSTL